MAEKRLEFAPGALEDQWLQSFTKSSTIELNRFAVAKGSRHFGCFG
jgi:hypothetical protein